MIYPLSIKHPARYQALTLLLIICIAALPAFAEPSSTLSQQALQRFLEGDIAQAESLAAESVRTYDDALGMALQSRLLAYQKDMRIADVKARDALREAPDDGLVVGLTLPSYCFGWKPDGTPHSKERRELAEKTLQLLPTPRTGQESYVRGIALFALGRYDEALAEAQRGVKLSPNMATLHRQVGNFCENLKRYEEAEQAYRQALVVNPRLAAVKADLGYMYLDRVKDSDRALAEFREGLQIDPNDVEVLFAMGDLSLRQGKAQDALRYLDNLLALNPKYGNAYYQRALAYQKLGDADKAVRNLKDYENLAPAEKRAIAFELAGDISYEEKKWSDAIDFYKSAETYAPAKTSFLVNRALARIEAKQDDEALVDLRRAAASNPDQGTTFFYIGWVLNQKDDIDGAIEAYSKAIDLEPKLPGAYGNRGLLYMQEKNRFDLAEADFDKAVAIKPEGVLNRLFRVDLYESTGRSDLAKAELKKAQSLPDYARYKDRSRTLFAGVAFDAEAAQAALAPGTGTIQGNAASRTGLFSKVKASDVKIALYPVTPYFQAWYDLRKQKENAKTTVHLTPEARQFCRTAETNDKGEFVFRDLKPGRYFAQAIFNYTERSVQDVVVGEEYDEDYDEYYDVYEQREYYTEHTDRLEGFATIDGEGQTAKLSLRQNNL